MNMTFNQEGKPVDPGVRTLPCKLLLRQSCGGDAIAVRNQGEALQES